MNGEYCYFNIPIFKDSLRLMGNLSKETQKSNSKDYKHPYVHCSIIYKCQDLETAQCPSVDECVKSCGMFTQWNATQPQ